MPSLPFWPFAAAALCLTAGAQTRTESPAIAYVEGDVTVDEQPLQRPASLSESSTIRTAGGRVEVRLRGGVRVALGPNIALRVMDNRPYSFDRLEMIGGTAVVTTGAGSASMLCEDAIKLPEGGVFHFDLRPISHGPYGENDCRFRVYHGAATVQLATMTTVLTAGKTMGLNRRCGDMIPWQKFDLAEVDELYRWAAKR